MSLALVWYIIDIQGGFQIRGPCYGPMVLILDIDMGLKDPYGTMLLRGWFQRVEVPENRGEPWKIRE